MAEDNHFVAHPDGGVTTEAAIAAQAAPATEPATTADAAPEAAAEPTTEPTAEPEAKPEGDEAPAAGDTLTAPPDSEEKTEE